MCAVCRGAALLQCAVCARMSKQQQQQQQQRASTPYYCSTSCLLRHWPQHAPAHAHCMQLSDDAYAGVMRDV